MFLAREILLNKMDVFNRLFWINMQGTGAPFPPTLIPKPPTSTAWVPTTPARLSATLYIADIVLAIFSTAAKCWKRNVVWRREEGKGTSGSVMVSKLD